MRSPIVEVSVAEVPIRLGQFLKLAGLAGDGGEARALIEAGEVTVNGRAEERRGAQLRSGDVVAVGEHRARVRAAPAQPDHAGHAGHAGHADHAGQPGQPGQADRAD